MLCRCRVKCHYTYDKEAGKVLIPGCWGTAIHGIESCSCRNTIETFEEYENDKYKNKLKELSQQIIELEKYNAQLQRTIKKLLCHI